MEWLGYAVVGGMVILRILVPVLVMVALVWALRRLNARWEAEIEVGQEAEPEPRLEKTRRPSGAPILERGGPIGELPG